MKPMTMRDRLLAVLNNRPVDRVPLIRLDSFSPLPDNDTRVAEAIRMGSDKHLFVNFPSSVHLRPYDAVRAEAEQILEAGGHTGRLEIQFSENVSYDAWRTSFRAVIDAVEAFVP